MAKTAKKAATKTAKKSTKSAKRLTHSEAVQGSNLASGVSEKPAKVVKAAKSAKTVAKKAAVEKTPNPLHEKLIALMARKEGATISDFQTVDGFNIPSMAVVRIAQRHGYEASASKKPGERTIYKAVKKS